MATGIARTLLVLRHAKAEAGGPGTDDVDRRLTGRGEKDATAAGHWLASRGIRPALVLCSAARRTRDTWQRLGAALGPAGAGPEVSFDSRLYRADAVMLLDIVRECPQETDVLLVVGHNPASHRLVHDLAGEPQAFPTCSLAVIELPGTWAGVSPGGGRLTALWTPRQPVGLPASPGGAR